MNENEILINGGYPLHTFEQVEDIYMVYISSQKDRNDIHRAYEFILNKHKDQKRRSGEPYYHHLVEVAYILAELQAGPTTIIAGLLHDVVEDTDVEIDDIKSMWGEDVAMLVDSLTKIQRLKLSKITKEEFEAEDHRKILIGMSKDIRVIIIKLADRLHNLRTLGALSPERQIALSQESLDVFVPIAHRLGLDNIRSEMADLCLKYLRPDKFNEITNLLSKKAKSLDKSLENVKKRIADCLFESNLPFEISSRVKSIYSIYTKMYLQNHSFDEIYDILALRIITDTEIQCYEILGLIHKIYSPVPGRMKDYIAMPKPNMYQSLHTTIVSGDGNFYEVQIRTHEMDQIAETGVASHWAYKEGSGYNAKEEQKEIENKLHWFRDFVSMTGDANDDTTASEYVDNLTHDIFEANVYVFTPKGKVIELPTNSTPVDFAYRIHSKIGDTTTGALVNGSIVSLDTILKTGDMVEIITSKKSGGPSERWLNFVKSANAKSCIRKFLAKKNADLLKDEKIEKGKQSCLDSFSEKGVNEDEMVNMLSDPKLLEHFEFETLDDLYIAVSNRKPVPGVLLDYLHISKPVDIPLNKNNNVKVTNSKDKCPVYCKGVSRLAISLASCCTPIPGDPIIGYITKGKGITVHRSNCPNIQNENERLIDVFWRDDLDFTTYPVDIMITANDRNNLLVNIMSVLTNNHIPVNNLHANSNSNQNAIITMTLLIGDAKKLRDITNILLNIQGVIDVSRLIH